MSEPEIDIAALVEAGARAYQLTDPDYDNSTTVARAILTAVLPLVLAGPKEALEPLDRQLTGLEREHRENPGYLAKLGDSFNMDNASLYASRLTIGDLRRARSTLTRIEALLKDESRGTEDG